MSHISLKLVLTIALCVALTGCSIVKHEEEREKWQRESWQYINDSFDYAHAVNREIIECTLEDDVAIRKQRHCEERRIANERECERLDEKAKELKQMERDLGIMP